MIKPLIYIIGGLMVSTLLVGELILPTGTGRAAGAEGESCERPETPAQEWECFSKAHGKSGPDWNKGGFGTLDPAEAGQNLFLMMYASNNVTPGNRAIEKNAEKYGMQYSQMESIVSGNLRPIFDRAKNLSITEANRIYSNIIISYNNLLNQEILTSKMERSVLAKEAFANGSLAEGGFDLVNDLNLIEYILFNRYDEVSIEMGDGPFGGNGDNNNNNPGAISANPTLPEIRPGGTTGNSGSNSGSTSSTKACEKIDLFAESRDDDQTKLFGGINPNQCFTPSNWDAAIAEFECAQAQAGTGEGSNENDADTKTCVASTEVCDNRDNDCDKLIDEELDCENSTAIFDLPALDVGINEAERAAISTPAAAGNWAIPSYCDETLCVWIELISGPVTAANNKMSFKVTDNCIACHVHFINESLQETIKHSLIPSKLTGNLGEVSQCKGAAVMGVSAIGLNVHLALAPVKVPPQNDLVIGSNIIKEWDLYASRNGAWNYNWKKKFESLEKKNANAQKTPTPAPAPPNPLDKATSLSLQAMEVEGAPSTAEVISKAVEILQDQAAVDKKDGEELAFAREISLESTDNDTLDKQMRTMNSYFSGFSRLLSGLYQETPGTSSSLACKDIMTKQKCE